MFVSFCCILFYFVILYLLFIMLVCKVTFFIAFLLGVFDIKIHFRFLSESLFCILNQHSSNVIILETNDYSTYISANAVHYDVVSLIYERRYLNVTVNIQPTRRTVTTLKSLNSHSEKTLLIIVLQV